MWGRILKKRHSREIVTMKRANDVDTTICCGLMSKFYNYSNSNSLTTTVVNRLLYNFTQCTYWQHWALLGSRIHVKDLGTWCCVWLENPHLGNVAWSSKPAIDPKKKNVSGNRARRWRAAERDSNRSIFCPKVRRIAPFYPPGVFVVNNYRDLNTTLSLSSDGVLVHQHRILISRHFIHMFFFFK